MYLAERDNNSFNVLFFRSICMQSVFIMEKGTSRQEKKTISSHRNADCSLKNASLNVTNVLLIKKSSISIVYNFSFTERTICLSR